MQSLAKIYDYVLCNRLLKWFVPDREQAGAQPGRSCLEQIRPTSLSLLIDFAVENKTKLYIIFIDFSKAYDKVPRNMLKGLAQAEIIKNW